MSNAAYDSDCSLVIEWSVRDSESRGGILDCYVDVGGVVSLHAHSLEDEWTS